MMLRLTCPLEARMSLRCPAGGPSTQSFQTHQTYLIWVKALDIIFWYLLYVSKIKSKWIINDHPWSSSLKPWSFQVPCCLALSCQEAQHCPGRGEWRSPHQDMRIIHIGQWFVDCWFIFCLLDVLGPRIQISGIQEKGSTEALEFAWWIIAFPAVWELIQALAALKRAPVSPKGTWAGAHRGFRAFVAVW